MEFWGGISPISGGFRLRRIRGLELEGAVSEGSTGQEVSTEGLGLWGLDFRIILVRV